VRGITPLALYRKAKVEGGGNKKTSSRNKMKRKDEKVEYIFTTPPWDSQTRSSDVIICIAPKNKK
jgi:hypothetical protein